MNVRVKVRVRVEVEVEAKVYGMEKWYVSRFYSPLTGTLFCILGTLFVHKGL